MIEFSDFSDFIFTQKDDRHINMSESAYSKEKEPYCGCIMVHYAVERLKQDNIICGVEEIHNYDTGKDITLCPKGVSFIRHSIMHRVKTYKDAKLIMNDLLDFYAS